MPQQFSISIDRIVDLLGLEREPKNRRGNSYNVRCPFCGDTKYHMNINTEKNAYNCVICTGEKNGGGALDLYGRVALGTPLIPGKAENGGNGDVLYKKLAKALRIPQPVDYERTAKKRREVRAIYPASDDALNRCYTALLNLDPLRLADQHKANLMKRGLNEESIIHNGYRSMPEDCEWVYQYPQSVDEFQKANIAKSLGKYQKVKCRQKEQMIAGFIVGQELRKLDVLMERVPGFFKLNGYWLFNWEPGMLIPTRNRNGQIVGLQVRKDKGDLRYMTVSSKGLPEGVTDGISRIHFPLANSQLESATSIYLIEGPLKSDVTAHLIEEDAFFVAIQGVNNQNGLTEFFEEMKAVGANVIYNAFDMDKLTNPHVAAAGRSFRKKAGKSGIKVKMKLWDEVYARTKWLELVSLCVYHQIEVDLEPENIFTEVGKLAEALYRKKIQHSIYYDSDGKAHKDYWTDETKGIDDFLLSSKSSST